MKRNNRFIACTASAMAVCLSLTAVPFVNVQAATVAEQGMQANTIYVDPFVDADKAVKSTESMRISTMEKLEELHVVYIGDVKTWSDGISVGSGMDKVAVENTKSDTGYYWDDVSGDGDGEVDEGEVTEVDKLNYFIQKTSSTANPANTYQLRYVGNGKEVVAYTNVGSAARKLKLTDIPAPNVAKTDYGYIPVDTESIRVAIKNALIEAENTFNTERNNGVEESVARTNLKNNIEAALRIGDVHYADVSMYATNEKKYNVNINVTPTTGEAKRYTVKVFAGVNAFPQIEYAGEAIQSIAESISKNTKTVDLSTSARIRSYLLQQGYHVSDPVGVLKVTANKQYTINGAIVASVDESGNITYTKISADALKKGKKVSLSEGTLASGKNAITGTEWTYTDMETLILVSMKDEITGDRVTYSIDDDTKGKGHKTVKRVIKTAQGGKTTDYLDWDEALLDDDSNFNALVGPFYLQTVYKLIQD